MPKPKTEHPDTLRCAIYTRKSHEEGLEQDFNSLDAQREACEAYITSQRHEGWTVSPDFYDDGGISGATMERPALQRLLSDITAGRIDIVVVYKVDRLTRALSDFARIVDTFDENGVSFVSVTQQFNTTTSMGRLTLNVLLSFAQFEREVTAERIRDKIAASKKKGMWMGGVPPLGYEADNRKLVVIEDEAERVRYIFRRYLELGSVLSLKDVLVAEGIVSKVRVSETGKQTGGVPFNRGALYHLLQNRIYLGEITHKGACYPGLHDAIVPQDLWDDVQVLLQEKRVERHSGARTGEPSLLAGLIFDDHGARMTPSHAVKKGKRYRYYVSRHLTTARKSKAKPGRRTPAGEIENLVADHIGRLIGDEHAVLAAVQHRTGDPDQQQRTLRTVRAVGVEWRHLEPAERRRILLSLIVRIDVQADRVDIQVRTDALANLSLDDDKVRPVADGPVQTLSVPARLKRAGMETRLIVDGPHAEGKTRKPDRSLVRLMLTGQRYHEMVLKADGRSIQQLCDEEGVTRSYFTRALRLAYLSPEIVKRILDGTQPLDMKASTLKAASRLPLDWAEQKALFGIA
ncbi:MAG: recombinase family protein [Rhodospirillales bacterium]